ncbi:MAG: T9SS type A sorting domain-containing protein [Cyclobacteriaceae bacterium]
MKFRLLVLILLSYCIGILWVVNISSKKVAIEYTPEEFNGPEQFTLLHRAIRTPEDAVGPQYERGFIIRELSKAKAISARKRFVARTQSNGVIEWKERGPANVPGRTRGLLVDPDDPTKNTWFAASAGGGVWKTTNAGNSWNLLTPDLTNLATTVLAMAESNHDIIYLGTGESFGGLVGIRGNGMFKSEDRGQSWSYLSSTIDFSDINRIIVNPTDANSVVVATAIGIFITTNGGDSWLQVSTLGGVEDLKATPGNFNIQYASQNGVGILKSTDAGINWTLSNTGMSPSGRIEIAISPVNTNRIFASAQGTLAGSQSDLYVSDNGGLSWSVVNVAFNNTAVDFLGGQGWYDNTILCDPFNADVVYFGGVSLFRTQLESGSSSVNSYSIEEQNTTFLSLVNFGAAFSGGRLAIGTLANASVEVRFGPGKSQKAYRFLTPIGATSGVPDVSYSYADYVDVPFEVWDITNNKQLMVSFRDQDRNGQFNLLLQNTEAEATAQSREYIYISNVEYNPVNPSSSIATAGGHIFQQMYFFWPVLAVGKNWPADVVDSKLKINFSSLPKQNATTNPVADAYNQFDGKNRFVTFGSDVHPDHHNLVAIPTSATTYRILNASDGGIFVSNISTTPGINQGDWSMVGRSYNTSQFYGADKRPGIDEYFGGMQDNGTWKSPGGINASNTTNYQFSIGGDGFEVVWHKLDDKKLIGGSQGNNFRKSVDGGVSWTVATTGLSGTHPFVSKLANSKDNPDVLFTLSSAGVFRSPNFGTSWILTPITDKWGTSTSLMDVEVSQANANIIWAGSGMVNAGNFKNLHVSTDGGLTFTPTINYTDVVLGGITKLASHPLKDSTAYALFSFAGKPKILRTNNLGKSWQDISGFGAMTISSTGFPDVAVYCLYVRPDNPDIIWVGTEIGIVESLDNGQSWSLLEDFPNVAVWNMNGQDDQVVVATHGRGIWTGQIENRQSILMNPKINTIGTSPKSVLVLDITLLEVFDSTQIWLQGMKAGKINKVIPGNYVVKLPAAPKGAIQAKLISYRGTAPFHSEVVTGENLLLKSPQQQYFNYFSNANDFSLSSFSVQPFGNSNSSMQSFHNYPINTDLIALLKQPVIITNEYPFFFYRDVAIVEPGNSGSVFGQPQFKDYVVVEGTKDGVTWIPISPGYDASVNADWLSTYTSNQSGSNTQYVDHSIDLSTKFAPGDTLLFRFRLFSDNSGTAWGWSVDDLYIQQKPTGVNEIHKRAIIELDAYPNPTPGPITVAFTLNQKSTVDLVFFDQSGRMVYSKSLGLLESGEHKEIISFSAQNGQYLLQLRTNSRQQVKKVVVRN